MIEGDSISEDKIFEIIRRAHTRLPEDVLSELKKAYKSEKEPIPKLQLKNILDNVKISEERGIPMCQDTGVPVFYVFGKNIDTKALTKTIEATYKRAKNEIPLRQNLVDPLTREQSHKVQIYFEYSEREQLHYLPKGAGSENMSQSKMLLPSSSEKEIIEFILETVKAAGGNPCPPIILGIGIGGTLDYSAYLSKRALLKSINKNTELEKKITEQVNSLGIGPMGLGGKTTCLGTNIETFPSHTASLPVTINIQCWANRHIGVKLGDQIEYI